MLKRFLMTDAPSVGEIKVDQLHGIARSPDKPVGLSFMGPT